MPQKDSNSLVTAIDGANVTIAFKGLGLSNYNKANENWELIFINHDTHTLDLTVNKFRSGEFEDSAAYEIDPNERIFVRSNRAVRLPHRHVSGDDLDINNFFDFSSDELYGESVKLKNALDDPLIFLSISDSSFYTKKLTQTKFRILKDGVPLGDPKRVGMVLGADIVCEIGGMTEILLNSTPNQIPPLVAEDDVIYELIFDNTCPEPPTDGRSDFDIYDESFDMPSTFTMEKATATLFGEKEPPCNKAIISDLDNLDSLAELLTEGE